ncbi:DUF4142 domain-containing protein [Paracoccus sp. SSK6]|uniref:DUF4142 domain-containing protein n=1 Tax=Paracoccus sp. SSK6 TaxID=3143131 RepID=UPI00321A35F1
MDRRTLFAAGALAAMMPATGPGFAQTAPDREKQPILLAGNFALLTSRLAADRAADPAVKAFSALEISEQQAVAQAFGAAPSEQLTPEHAAMLEELTALPAGPEFDMKYLDGQLTGHEQLRALHASYAKGGSDPRAQGASIVAVPAIDSHLSMLRAIRQRMG